MYTGSIQERVLESNKNNTSPQAPGKRKNTACSNHTTITAKTVSTTMMYVLSPQKYAYFLPNSPH